MKPKHLALGIDGKALDISPEEVKQYCLSFLDDDKARLLFVIAEKPNGDLLVNVFGPPSRKTYRILKQALEQYDTSLKLNGV